MITIVFGKPGCGKTAYMTADAVKYMNGSKDCLDLLDVCRSQCGVFAPPELSPVYSNYPITVQHGYRKCRVSYYVDGFRLGLDNDSLGVFHVPPCSKIYLAEAQRYYNSRNSRDFPEWVSRFFEEHRHFGLDIMLDVQRPGLIDVNIRELCERFVEVLELKHDVDGVGNIKATTFVYREFSDWKYVDKYLASGDDSNSKVVQERFEGNVFDHYESRSYFNVFLPSEDSGFNYIVHSVGDEDIQRQYAWQFYPQTAPEGFYPVKGKSK